MMEPADHGLRLDLAEVRWLHRSRLWTILRQSEVRSRTVVVADVLPEHSTQVPLAQDDHVVETLPSDRTNRSLYIGIGVTRRLHPMRPLRHDVSTSPIHSIR